MKRLSVDYCGSTESSHQQQQQESVVVEELVSTTLLGTLTHTCWETHRPAGSDGKATDLSFLSSAADRQFFTVFSSWSSHFSEPHWGTLQWMTKRAAIPLAGLTATAQAHTGVTQAHTSVTRVSHRHTQVSHRHTEVLHRCHTGV